MKLGMTIEQAKKAMRSATIKATADGDGANLYQVKRGTALMMHLYLANAESVDAAQPAGIGVIRVFDPACATAEGVRPGMQILAVGKRYGNLIGLERSEVESREFARFEKLPNWVALEVHGGRGTAGVYAPGTRETQKYVRGASVQSLWVSIPPRE
ncbi:MAG: hypothetical protein NTY38_12255 [Acidobacteria bacterium]|nr:hypothetical protein [Acidobacteriota bacterium]